MAIRFDFASHAFLLSVGVEIYYPNLLAFFAVCFFFQATTLRLTLIPRMEFANGISRVSELLKIYPKEQTTKDRKWVVFFGNAPRREMEGNN